MSKIVLLIVVIVGVLGSLAVALPQRPYTQPLISTTDATQNLQGTSPGVGWITHIQSEWRCRCPIGPKQAVGTPDHHVIGQVFSAGNTQTKPVSTPVTSGATLGYNNHGHGLELTKTHTPGVRDSFQQTATANLFNNGVHNLDAKAFASQNQLANGFKFDRNEAALDYSHIKGHGATLTHANIPGLGKQLELGGRANLWQSQDRNTRLDLGSTASKWTSGPFKGQTDLGANLGLSHYFG
uniref:IP02545p n=1 Tax=Drosophila melanogaster TaxID=7227 RepID=Q29QF8_DROME|nr:IP02545p [Drosophila melanogaster]